MKQKKLMKWFVMFFAVMLIFTLLSRAADSVNVARVTVKTIQNQLITHKVSGEGKIEGVRERAVFTKGNLKIAQVPVKEGQSVKKGDILLRLSSDSIKEAIQGKEDEAEELTLNIGDLESQAAVEARQRETEQAWARYSYGLAERSSQINVDNARQEVNIAKQRLEEYYASIEFSDGSQEETDRETALQDDLRLKQEALNQAIAGSNQEISSAKKQIQDADMPKARDSTIQNLQRELENVQEELKGLKKLLKKKGAVKAPGDGVIKSISVVTGGLTSEEAAVVLYRTGGDMRMTGSISGEDAKYVEIGGSVQVKGPDGTEIEGAVAEAVTENDSSLSTIYIGIPEGSLSIGQTAQFTAAQDAGPFRACIPLSALHEENGKAFVYVVDTRDSVLGEILVARRVEVTVKDKNESSAALEEGSLSGDQKIIVDSNREITEGSRVRLQES